MRRLSALSLALASLCTLALAQSRWLPAPAREKLERSLVEALQAVDEEGRMTPETALQAARTVVDGVGATLESLGLEAVIERAPVYPGLELPATGTAALDALVAYQLCSVPFDHEARDDSPREGREDLRTWALLLSASTYLVSGYLRQGYLEAGVTDEQAEALLRSDAVASLRARIEASPELLQSVKQRCGPPFLTFLQ